MPARTRSTKAETKAVCGPEAMLSLGKKGRTFFCRLRHYSSQSGPISEEELRRLNEQLINSTTALILPDKTANNSTRTLTILVGWTSCSLRALTKCAPPYTKVGIPVVCVPSSLLQVWSTTLRLKLMHSLLRSIDRSLNEPVSLVLHMFSAGACVVLPETISDFESTDRKLTRKLNPACAVFDSGPVLVSYSRGIAALRLLYQQGAYNYPTYLTAVGTGIPFNILFGKRRRAEMNQALRSPLLDVPQLYLYSEADTVATPSVVQKAMLDQQAMGRDVVSHCWKDSPHVRHYLTDPVIYEHHVHSLLKKCKLI